MPSSKEIQIAKLFSYNASYSKAVSDIYIGSTKAHDRAHQRLLVLIEVPAHRSDSQKVVDEIIEESVSVFESSDKTTPEQVLESILEALNSLLPELAQKKNSHWLEELNVLVSVTEHGQIHFSQIGDLQGLLIQGNSITDVTETQDEFNPHKIFSHITSGLLNPGDGLIFSTYALTDYIADDKLRQLIYELPPDAVVSEFEKLLNEVPRFVSFASIVIKFTTDMDSLAAKNIERQKEESVVESTERELKDTSDSYEPPKRQHVQRRRRRVRGFGDIIVVGFHHFVDYLKILGKLFVLFFLTLASVAKALIYPSQQVNHEKKFVDRIGAASAQFKEKISALPKFTTIAVTILIILVLGLLHIFIVQSQQQVIVETRDLFNEGLAQVANKRQAVNNAIIYDDERAAENLLIEIDQVLNSIEPSSKEQEEQLLELIDENARELNKIRHINYISDPLVYYTFTDDIVEKPSAISYANESVLVARGKTLYSVDNSQHIALADASDPIRAIAGTDDGAYILTFANTLYELDGSSMEEIDFDRNLDSTAVTAVEKYSNNLYVLDENQKTIYKHSGTTSGLRGGTVWLENEAMLKGAHDLGIDGSVYIITSDGSILKFLKAEREDFSYTQPHPRIGNDSELYTGTDTNNIFILDKENNRIIIISKEGNIVDQFTSPKFDELTSMAINTSEDTIYVLSGNAVYLLAIKD